MVVEKSAQSQPKSPTSPLSPSYPPQVIETDDSGFSDLDSVYSDEDLKSITDTLASSIKDYKYENGRRYHAYKEGSWMIPNDEAMQDQMDLFHEVYTRAENAENGLFLAPITPNPQRILDLGTGTGIWAMRVADMYPSAAVVGNDLSPIQPEWLPPNCAFEVDDFNEEWTYTPGSFDYIHARAIHAGVSDWGRLLKSAYRALKPGGWIEIAGEGTDFHCDDDSLRDDSVLHAWTRNATEVFTRIQKPLKPYDTMKENMLAAGFDEMTIVEREFKMPIGTWPRDKGLKILGAMYLVNLLNAVEGWILAPYTRILGKEKEWTMQHIEEIKKALKTRKCHAYNYFHVIYAQKPADRRI